ncbi:chaperone protein DnaJ [Senna tora]|uniref:Chaperone protein DnaJ n=1 Tax=Senna tora TaxID=362788 RepID=A0A834T8F2_9FABA|nr:chaperone protein DnaJ [Senna tora]
MMWDEWDDNIPEAEQPDQDSYLNFDFFSALAKPKDYYKILEVDYDATDDAIRSNYIRLALEFGANLALLLWAQKWHPDKLKDQDAATSRFQEINEAYQESELIIDFCVKWVNELFDALNLQESYLPHLHNEFDVIAPTVKRMPSPKLGTIRLITLILCIIPFQMCLSVTIAAFFSN